MWEFHRQRLRERGQEHFLARKFKWFSSNASEIRIRSSSELGGAVRAVRSSQGMSLKVTLAWFRRVRQFLKARSGSLPFVAIGEAEWELRVTEDPKDRQGSDRPFPARWRRWRVQVSRRSWRLPRPPSRRRMRAIRFPLLHCHLRHPQHRTPGADGYFWQRRWLA